MATFSEEQFKTMIRELDKDGDGQVSKAEFYHVYSKMKPDIGAIDGDGFQQLWGELDEDGNDDLSVEELAKFYGYNLEAGVATEMTDENILEALALQSQIDKLQADAGKKAEETTAPTAVVDKTIELVTERDASDEAPKEKQEQRSFLIDIEIGDFTSKQNEEEYAWKYIDDETRGEAGPIYVRIQDEKGETPLHKMARIKNRPKDLPQLFNKVILLMRDQCKAKKRVGIQPDINKQSKAGKTPLFLAVEFQNEAMIDLLFGLGRDGPDVLLVNSEGQTAFHMGVIQDDLTMLKKLVSHISAARLKLLLKTADKTGREPLHIAASRTQFPQMVEYLMDLGASDDTKDIGGKLASELADQLSQTAVDPEKKAHRRASREIIDEKMKVRYGRQSKEEADAAALAAAKGRRRSASRELPTL